jgi:hypothetical protein
MASTIEESPADGTIDRATRFDNAAMPARVLSLLLKRLAA